ncbi:hypothetical protein C8F04DRAFT_1200898 [Mycena alexandri]|uniref:DUF6534 domain-containing protein n=1 Tax=Mycena alexandri TaxID=1745969 RepID=A0AAD6WQG1_9AGAR|nr:hypothetical protein C8F04DRAFT_1200898 [Mycena alexandri]
MAVTYGAMFVGVLFPTLYDFSNPEVLPLIPRNDSFQGVLTIQAYIYYESFPTDRPRLKFLVASVWLLDVAHLVLICQSCYHYLVASWGDNAALLISTQELDLHLVFVGMVSAVCQGFFLTRWVDVYTFRGKNRILTGALSAACLTTLALEAAMSAQNSRVPSVAAFNSFTGEVLAVFALAAAGLFDIAIAVILVWYLQQGKTSFDRTSFVVARVVQYTVATGLATSGAWTNLLQAMHFSLGRMYTNAARNAQLSAEPTQGLG